MYIVYYQTSNRAGYQCEVETEQQQKCCKPDFDCGRKRRAAGIVCKRNRKIYDCGSGTDAETYVKGQKVAGIMDGWIIRCLYAVLPCSMDNYEAA